MATTDALKGKNALITAASILGAIALEFVLDRRGDAGKASEKVSEVVGKLPGTAGDLMDDLGRGVKSVTGKATTALSADDDGEDADGADGVGLDELAERRREREERRERRRKAI